MLLFILHVRAVTSTVLEELLFVAALCSAKKTSTFYVGVLGIIFPLLFQVLVFREDCLFFRITITTEGKYAALSAINRVVELVNDEDSEVRLNALKVSFFPFFSHF